MSRTSTRLIAGLDAAARRTGIPALAAQGPRRRRFRWLPAVLLLLAFGAAGYGLLDSKKGVLLAVPLIVIPLLMLVVLSTVPTLFASWSLPFGEDD